ncbi:single-stranded DNA-binding protein [Arthrobacter sp. efr-133-TYG-118]|uniref:single-stranded DNA-binding protein n=1 Tax=Arthrobacter sp. efr-133-TYG-118 TaxID=3040279 RepID=UPI00254F29FC|nr:single-stranded DNA-binding protein [Arthrobacter sp. efr-133-TYG-118]
MSNVANNGTIIGRLARDPKVFANEDGSAKVVFTVFVNRNYKNRAGERLADAIPLETFINKDANFEATPYANVHKGDLVAVGTELRMNEYERGGETVRDLKVITTGITFLESRHTVQNRLAQRVSAAEQTNREVQAAPAAAAPAPVPAGVAARDSSAVQDELPFGN